MTNISDDRIKELREWLTSLTSGSDDDIRADLLSILDDHSSLRAENELLREDFEYKNEQLGSALIRAEKSEAEVKHRCDQRDAALESCSLVSAENERLRKDNNYFHAGFDSVREDYEEQKARAEKAEAELEKMTKAIESWKKDEVIWKETEAKLLAQLAKQAPLIQAVMGLDEIDFIADDWPSEKLRESADKLRSEK